MIFVDITVTGVALPSIGADLGVTTQALSWVTNAYLVALAALMALGGRTGDIIGKRSAFLAGVAVFAGASIVCASAPTMELLLTGRILQGLGAALMQPASASLVIENFAPGERGKAMGIYIGIPMTFFASLTCCREVANLPNSFSSCANSNLKLGLAGERASNPW